MLRGAVAGMVAAAAWAVAEPLVSRLVRPPTGYSDVRLLGGLLVGERSSWRAAGLAAHVANGAVFGAAFARLGGRGPRHGLAAAQAQNVLLWPAFAVVDRVHPDRRHGAWPPLLPCGRVFAYEAAVHALFGVILGALAGPPQSSSKFAS